MEKVIKTIENHKQLVRALAKNGETILKTLTPESAHILHMLLGKMTELGELADAFKKHLIYHKPLDLQNVIEELGDEEFYTEGLRASIGVDRTDVLQANIDKLNKRYPTGSFSNKDAIERKDKQD
jgi:NTP pyrophosphatase (non-canonical NTP hydrolase)